MSTKTTPTPPVGKITCAIFNLLSVLAENEPLITKQTTRTDAADVLATTARIIRQHADRLSLTPAQANTLRQIQTKLDTATLN